MIKTEIGDDTLKYINKINFYNINASSFYFLYHNKVMILIPYYQGMI